MDLAEMGEQTKRIYLKGKRDGYIQGYRDGTESYHKALDSWLLDLEGDNDDWSKRDTTTTDEQC